MSPPQRKEGVDQPIAARLRYRNQTRAAERQCWRNEDESPSGERFPHVLIYLHSGMGAYGGKAGFLTFSHARSIYRQGKSPEAELALRPPFTPAFQASLSEAIIRG